jgi:pantoate kinase
LNEAQAFSPAHITGFFQICDQPSDSLQKGSVGAGFSITRGVTTKVQIKESAKNSVKITINGNIAKSAPVSGHVVNAFLALAGGSYEVLVEHHVGVPVGCGFGSSGAGALSLALALNEALNLSLSREEAAQIAHIAEVECKTGLGTVIAETYGGAEIRIKPGAPGVGQLKHIQVNYDHIAACLSFGSIATKDILTSKTARQRINKLGGDLVERLVRHPTIPNFLKLSRMFAEHAGFISKQLRNVLNETDRAGLTCSIAMLGDTLFTIVRRDQIEKVKEILSRHVTSQGNIIIAEIDTQGARLL